MARYTGPKTKICRIFGEPILGNAKWLGKNSNPPGQHGAQRKRKQLGEYALQLREKQKANIHLWCIRASIPQNIWGSFSYQRCYRWKLDQIIRISFGQYHLQNGINS